MSKPKFTWDSSCLTPTVIEVPVPTKSGPVTVSFREFSRAELLKFFEESATLDLYAEVPNPYYDADLGETAENPKTLMATRPVTDIEGERFEIVCKYLAIATGQTEDWWKTDATVTVAGYGHLVDLLYQINHVSEILAAQGNYLALPAHLRSMEAQETED